jgi:hypothetical protein
MIDNTIEIKKSTLTTREYSIRLIWLINVTIILYFLGNLYLMISTAKLYRASKSLGYALVPLSGLCYTVVSMWVLFVMMFGTTDLMAGWETLFFTLNILIAAFFTLLIGVMINYSV